MRLDEISLGRVWQYFTNPEYSAAVLTAFRGNNKPDKNIALNKVLAADIRNAGYGFVYLEGHWVENEGTEDQLYVQEISILTHSSADDTKFIPKMHELGNKFGQDAVLVKDVKGTRLIYANGDEILIGEIKPGKLGSVYSRLRNNKAANTFIFEAEKEDGGWMGRMIEAAIARNEKQK